LTKAKKTKGQYWQSSRNVFIISGNFVLQVNIPLINRYYCVGYRYGDFQGFRKYIIPIQY